MNLTKSKIKFNSFTKPLDDLESDNSQQNIVGYFSLENDSCEYYSPLSDPEQILLFEA